MAEPAVYQLVEELAGVPAGGLTGPVAVLSAMITPAVLISACGSLAISTSNRLGRTIERARRLSDQFAALAREAAAGGGPEVMEQIAEQRAMLFDQLERATRRSRLLQLAMMRLHLAIGAFVATGGHSGRNGFRMAGRPTPRARGADRAPIRASVVGAGVAQTGALIPC
jgi:hypothetical protein